MAMRVPAPNSSDRPELGSGEMPENGRSRRKRVPKTCDCCGPNGKPHVPGHDQITKKRGRKKKEMVNHENVATEEEVASSEMELVTLDVDTVTVSEMEEAASSKGKPDVSQTEGKIVSEVKEASVMVNGTEKSPETHTNCLDSSLSASTHTKELSSSEQDHSETSATVDNSDVLAGSATSSDSQKPSESQPGVSAHNDAMETEPTTLSADVSNGVFWDHLYCRPISGESRNSCIEVTSDPSASTPVEITTEGIIEVIHGMYGLGFTHITHHFTHAVIFCLY